MALDYWKLGGKLSSYNPLPTGLGNTVNNLLPLNEYKLSFYASSASNANLRVSDDATVYKDSGLSPVRKKYEFTFTPKKKFIYLFDQGAKGDIFIDSIELVQKPLPKPTINGIDGFTSGKWTLHANARVVDDETLVLNATAPTQLSYFDIPALPKTVYVISANLSDSNAKIGIGYLDESKNYLSGQGTPASGWDITNNPSGVFTTPSNAILIRVQLFSSVAGTFTFKRPMLNLGNVPAPYSKKTGERMVMPVVKKNLFKKDTVISGYYINHTSGAQVVSGAGNKVTDFIPIKPSMTYSFSNLVAIGSANGLAFYDMNKSFISGIVYNGTLPSSVTSPSNAYFVRFTLATPYDLGQLEQGTTPTAYEPYSVQVNKKPQRAIAKARTGLVMDGVSNYVQLPSMTMDAIEIECLIEDGQSGNFLFDARTGLANGYAYGGGGFGTDVLARYVDGAINGSIPTKQRTKLKYTYKQSFTDDVTIFSSYAQTYKLKGILYKVTCYLGGQIVAQYDFENPSNIVGDKIIPNAKNLIPSFEDSRWSLHSNFRVLGRDVGRLDATGAWQSTELVLDVVQGKQYVFTMPNVLKRVRLYQGFNDSFPTIWGGDAFPGKVEFTTTNTKVLIRLSSDASGSFDFIRPQLYALDGKEATLYGTPLKTKKQPKRTLYAKR